MNEVTAEFIPRLRARRRNGRFFHAICVAASLAGLAFLIVLIGRVLWEGLPSFSLKFLNSFPSRLFPDKAGVKSPLWGSVWLIGMTGLFSVPVGVAAAVYLEEYAPNNRLTRFIQVNIANLAGVPSIVYGMLGLAVFVRWLSFDYSVLSGALTLSLLIMPVIILATREALLAVPQSFRRAAYALGATRWQTVRTHVLPPAMPGIMTGIILATSRAIGEAAPLLLIGGVAYARFVPHGPMDAFTALPLQIFQWTESPLEVFHELAAAGIIALLGILLPMNAVAVAIRIWHQRSKVW